MNFSYFMFPRNRKSREYNKRCGDHVTALLDLSILQIGACNITYIARYRHFTWCVSTNDVFLKWCYQRELRIYIMIFISNNRPTLKHFLLLLLCVWVCVCECGCVCLCVCWGGWLRCGSRLWVSQFHSLNGAISSSLFHRLLLFVLQNSPQYGRLRIQAHMLEPVQRAAILSLNVTISSSSFIPFHVVIISCLLL